MTSDKKKIKVVAAAIRNGNGILIAKRSIHQAHSGLWEFPGGKVEALESEEMALQREILEELGCQIAVAGFIAKSSVLVGENIIQMSLFDCRLISGEPRNFEHQSLRWISIDDVDRFQWAPADIPLLGTLRTYISGQER